MVPRAPRATPLYSSAASDVYKRQDQAPADQLGVGDDVGVADAPAHLAVLLERKGLDLGLDEDVRQAGRADDGLDRRSGPMRPAKLARPGDQAVGDEPVLHDEQARRIPRGAGGSVEDRGGQARGPCSGRALDTDLGAAEPLEADPRAFAVLEELAPGLGEGEDGVAAPGARPAVADPEAAGVPDARLARLRRHDPCAAGPGAGVSAEGLSAISATIALVSARSPAGEMGNTERS